MLLPPETKGRRSSKRLEEKRLHKTQDLNSTPSRKGQKGSSHAPPAPPPPPPPPVPPFVEASTPQLRVKSRKPLTPIQNRLNQVCSAIAYHKCSCYDFKGAIMWKNHLDFDEGHVLMIF